MPMNNRIMVPRNSFTPASIPNLSLWLDPSDLSTLSQTSDGSTPVTANDNPVAYIRGKGSNTALTQTTDANRPLWKSAGLGGRPCLDFDGSNDLLETTATVTSGQSRTVFAVTIWLRNASATELASMGSTAFAGGARWLMRHGTGASAVIGGDAVATNQTLAAGEQAGWLSPHIDCWSQNSGTRNLSYYLNGASLTVNSNPPNGQTVFGGFILGAARTGSTFGWWEGSIGEIVVYDRELTEAERGRVHRYLSARWGIAIT